MDGTDVDPMGNPHVPEIRSCPQSFRRVHQSGKSQGQYCLPGSKAAVSGVDRRENCLFSLPVPNDQHKSKTALLQHITGTPKWIYRISQTAEYPVYITRYETQKFIEGIPNEGIILSEQIMG